MSNSEEKSVVKMEHHVQQELCRTRPPYRQGKKLTAVKVYTVNDESQHIIISGVPKIQLKDEVQRIVAPYGVVKTIKVIPDYPSEEFTETIHINYDRIQSARIAKRFLDGNNFFGGVLHVFYAPELETVAETRRKLIQRRKDIIVRIRRHQQDSTNLQTNQFEPRAQYHRQKKYPALPLTEDRLTQQYPGESFSSINNGIPRHIDPRPVLEPSLPGTSGVCSFPPSDKIFKSNVKKKNYKDQKINRKPVVRVIRPTLIDTKKLPHFDSKPKVNKNIKNAAPIFKKVDSGIRIKLISNRDESKKRIVMENSSTPRLIQPSDDLQSSIKSAKLLIREAMQKN